MKHVALVKPFLLIIITLVLFSCASTRKQDGFSYRPAYSSPDFGAGEENEIAQTTLPLPPANENTTESVQLNQEQKIQLQDIVQSGLDQQQLQSDQDFKTTVRKMAIGYGEKNQVSYSEKQLKKLDRISGKLEKMKKKEGGPDVSWGPSNNLEWAILGAAAVGLFVGIFGVGFGWVVFLIAALAYLFFKLIHKN